MARAFRFGLVVLAILMAPGVSQQAVAGAFEVVHRFQGGHDGAAPFAGLTKDHAGNLYGTTRGKPSDAIKNCSRGCGTAYRVGQRGEQPILSFNGEDGATPVAPLLFHGGKLYGTASDGGSHAHGVVFALSLAGKETVLHDFCSEPLSDNDTSCSDGAYPAGGLIADNAGNLYGTTGAGGGNCTEQGGCGTVFRIAPDGTFAVIYSFCSQPGCTDGAAPNGGLAADQAGNLYGAAISGGANGDGTVFEIKPDGSHETALYSFCSMDQCADGAGPAGGLIFDSQGNLYGTAVAGGYSGSRRCQGGCGVVFQLAGPDYAGERVLWAFKGAPDGHYPSAGVIRDPSTGILYGVTDQGGKPDACAFFGTDGCGTIFQVTPDGNETVLHRFAGKSDGALPAGNLLLQGSYVFGTTPYDGKRDCPGFVEGCGTIFKIQIK